jgi:uncharacterized BrkB/YihY/UPF0761 family membrane protein
MSDNPFTQPLRKTMNNPQLDWVRPRRMRRRMVMLFLALVIAQPILLVATGSPFSLLLILLPFILVMGSLNASIRGMTELRARDLDEREDKVRNTVYARLYWPGLALGMVAAFMMSTLENGGSLLPVGSGLSLFFVAIALPTLWLAWSLPDEPDAG